MEIIAIDEWLWSVTDSSCFNDKDNYNHKNNKCDNDDDDDDDDDDGDDHYLITNNAHIIIPKI